MPAASERYLNFESRRNGTMWVSDNRQQDTDSVLHFYRNVTFGHIDAKFRPKTHGTGPEFEPGGFLRGPTDAAGPGEICAHLLVTKAHS